MRQLGDTTCPKCGGLFWRKSAEWHRCAINNHAINEPIAINTPIPPLVVSGEEKAAVVVPSGLQRSANRRSKETYNEYMREYMKTYRARKRGPNAVDG